MPNEHKVIIILWNHETVVWNFLFICLLIYIIDYRSLVKIDLRPAKNTPIVIVCGVRSPKQFEDSVWYWHWSDAIISASFELNTKIAINTLARNSINEGNNNCYSALVQLCILIGVIVNQRFYRSKVWMTMLDRLQYVFSIYYFNYVIIFMLTYLP